MKFSLFPQETRGLDLLANLCSEVQRAVDVLAQLLGALGTDSAELLDELTSCETRATDLHYSILTHLRTSYVNPLPREDLYAFSRRLHDAVGALSGAGDLVQQSRLTWISQRASQQLELIGRQAQLALTAIADLNRLDDVEETWLQMVRLTHRINGTHRAWLGELGDIQKTATIIRHRAVADQLLTGAGFMRSFADHLGQVLVKES
ncbi:hypothetical protein ACQ3I4_14315 [Zafaria sp. Z1313]|uniref:hypothetical protein n=1 Tax=unclassified Zafaria TaxID=2828765 RepID=UPI002E771C4A|nr:hypothetical protein [Zafaria sp. J156]MEE1622099.1 hypothetical protein [Zafaria sp. J156]